MRERCQFGKTWLFVDITDSWKLVGWGKMGFKAQTCWTDLLAFWGVWNRSRILNFGPDRLFFRFSRALIYILYIYIYAEFNSWLFNTLRKEREGICGLLSFSAQISDMSKIPPSFKIHLRQWVTYPAIWCPPPGGTPVVRDPWPWLQCSGLGWGL